MEENHISGKGERAAIGGYLPQFDEFARFVYINLINKTLEWIRVADPLAEKLDDIQYSTFTEIHAYQIKWTTSDAVISFSSFLKIFPSLVVSWKKIKANNPGKIVVPHLITNKKASEHDQIKLQNGTTASFSDFINDVLKKIKTGLNPDDNWKPTLEQLKKSCDSEDEFQEFINLFDFQSDYQQKKFSVKNARQNKDEEDLKNLSRLIIEKVADPKKVVEFSYSKIINELGWNDRFKTIFNHELIVNKPTYQPIQTTIDVLNVKFSEIEKGYLFLIGGPGTGKSTLLNQWSKSIKEKVIKYYAFDFLSPSSPMNYYDRGNATNLFFDLVYQLKDAGVYKKPILPYKDIAFLKEVFFEQLNILGNKYRESREKTVILIDGLDHVPREYKDVANTFLKELPLPEVIPEGIIIVLGSQSFELEDIPQEIKKEFGTNERNIRMDAMTKESVHLYLDALNLNSSVTKREKDLIFDKSQGHPLYLSYITSRIEDSVSIEELLSELTTIDGNIENYYRKLWMPINNEENLVDFLGLISRINGSIKLKFIREWNVSRNILREFKAKAKILFNEDNESLTFFHNSFRQFLLTETSINYLTDGFDENANMDYHKRLATFYLDSKVVNSWNANYHLFQASDFEKFVEIVTPEHLSQQLLEFRPLGEVKQDAKMGIEIARRTKNISLLVRYLFSLSEIQSRLFTFSPLSFIEELINIERIDDAIGYLRSGKTLIADPSIALSIARLFIEKDIKTEGQLLYDLAYPDIIMNQRIKIDDSVQYEEVKNLLEEWVCTSVFFEKIDVVINIISSIDISAELNTHISEDTHQNLSNSLIFQLGHTLITQNRWDDFNKVLKLTQKSDTHVSKGLKNILLHLLREAIIQCLAEKDKNRSYTYLELLRKSFNRESVSDDTKILIADLIYRVTEDKIEVFEWIKEIRYPTTAEIAEELSLDTSLDEFETMIRLNKLLNLCNKNSTIDEVVPKEKGDEEVLALFQRMLYLTTRIYTDALSNVEIPDIKNRILPIVRFYYRTYNPHHKFWYKLTRAKDAYFDFLIYSVGELGDDALQQTAEFIFEEFNKNPKYWKASEQRNIIVALISNGLNSAAVEKQLESIQQFMLDDQDLDSRVQECLSQANVYSLINKSSKSEDFLKQSLVQSFGIGYRKDYQYSTWIDWLKKINTKDAEGAPNRIKWFLSHLNHIKSTTEGRAYWHASEDLLEAGLENNLNSGLIQLKWQLDKGLINFIDSHKIFLTHAIKNTKTYSDYALLIALYTDLYLLVAEEEDTQILNNILEKGFELSSVKFLNDYLEIIIRKININAFEANRHDLLKNIERFVQSKNLEINSFVENFSIPSYIGRKSESGSHNNIVLKNPYSRISEDEIITLCTDFDSLKQYILREDQANSYFNWSPVIKEISSDFSVEQIRELTSTIQIRKRESGFYSTLSEVALRKGDRILALELANRSLEISGESGWNVSYDGGSRINAFKALSEIDSELSSTKAFEIFAQDVQASNYPGYFLDELDNIIPLLVENVNEIQIWNEVFSYVQRLMNNSVVSTDVPTMSSENISFDKTLVDYIIYLCVFPISFVSDNSKLLLARFIHLKNDYATNIFKGDSIDDDLIFHVLLLLHKMDSPSAKDFISKFKTFSISRDLEKRLISKKILESYAEKILIPKTTELPGIYSIHLPLNTINSSVVADKKLMLTTSSETDPRYLTRPFIHLIRMLSDYSDLPVQNILFRTQAIMKEIDNEYNWSEKRELEIRAHLTDIDFKHSFRKPYIATARKAVMMAATELIDCNVIDESEIASFFNLKDPAMLLFPANNKPSFIHETKEVEDGGVKTNWVDRIEESGRLNDKIINHEGFYIIAEYTFLKNVDWELPTETFMSQLSDEEYSYNYGTDEIYEIIDVHQSESYSEIQDCGNSIVIKRDQILNFGENKDNWLAFNPVTAKELGWTPVKGKLFAWQNVNNEIMAESIYWMNGNVNMGTRHDGEVGEGWYVRISAVALQALKTLHQNLYYQKKIIRSAGSYSEEIESNILIKS